MGKQKRRTIRRDVFMSCWVDAINKNMTDKQLADSLGKTKGAVNTKIKQINIRLMEAGYEPLPRPRSESSYRTWGEIFKDLHEKGALIKKESK